MDFKHYLKKILSFSTMDFENEKINYQTLTNIFIKIFITIST